MSTKDLSNVAAYRFALPPELIAVAPARERGTSRLLVVGHDVKHHSFTEIASFLRHGDLLVTNDVRVVPARLYATKPTGGRVELFVLEELSDAATTTVRAMLGARRPVAVGTVLQLIQPDEGVAPIEIKVVAKQGPHATLEFSTTEAIDSLLARCGELPLPPYIVKSRRAQGLATYSSQDDERYQTVYANAGKAVAAPTAGLHFTPAILSAIENVGAQHLSLRLDVGEGTFKPMSGETVDDHEMHHESYVIDAELAAAFAETRARGGRVIAVGTTVVRSLEDQMQRFGEVRAGRYSTNIFLKPGCEFRAVDGLITNFHLPESTLLVLVAAFAGYERVMQAYAEAIEREYTFYSYGDAMLLWPQESV